MIKHPDNPTLPEDWIECRLEQIAEVISGKSQKEVESPNGKYPIYGSGGRFGRAKDFICEPGTTIIGRKGTINSPIFVNERFWNVDTAFGIASLSANLEARFLHFFCRSFNFTKLDKSTTIPSLAKRDIAAIPIPLAPLPEQRAIVAKIEQLFSELDNGIENLKTARAKLDIYRQAVLKKAFEGELTREWRAKQTDLPTAEELLEQIKAERQKHYDTQLAEWKAAVKTWEANGLSAKAQAGKPGKKPKKPGKLKELPPLAAGELDALPILPAEWACSRLLGIAEIGSGMAVSKSRKLHDPIEVPYLRVANVQRGHLLLGEIKTMPIERTFLSDFELKKWDVLFNEGGDRDKLGRGWIWENQVCPCITQNHVFRASLHSPGKDQAKFISHWGNTFGRDYFERTGKQTTNLASINKTVLSMFPVPVVSSEEQHQIVQEIESRLSVCDKLAETIDTSLKQAESLRQSILKKAFAGRLLTPAERTACRHAPDYCPAQELVGEVRDRRGTE